MQRDPLVSRPRKRSPFSGLPQLFLSAGCAALAFSGAWLWWLGSELPNNVQLTNELADPFTVQIWIRRIHLVSTYVVAAVVAFVALRSLLQFQTWRTVFAVAFLAFFAVGIWSGLTTDWIAARLWSETIGTKIRAGLDISGGSPLPESLQRARVHLSIVPAALLIVAFASFDHYRRT